MFDFCRNVEIRNILYLPGKKTKQNTNITFNRIKTNKVIKKKFEIKTKNTEVHICRKK